MARVCPYLGGSVIPFHPVPEVVSAMRILLLAFAVIAGLGLPSSSTAAPSGKLDIKDGDRVLWIGGTLVEREQIYGYWEAMLTAAYPDRTIKFRNLGWSGDTVWADSRGMFDSPAEGYKRMLAMARDYKPTLIILAYGGNESFAGPDGVQKFVDQYQKLIADLKGSDARFAFLLPVDMEPASTVDPKLAVAFNNDVVAYRDAIRKIADGEKAPVIDLTKPSNAESAISGQRMTTDGLHGTAVGYWALAHRLRDQVQVSQTGVVLPLPANAYPPEPTSASADRLEQLRLAIIAKNELFFHRWRPQNFTYLFGFRKHEQGNNAVEIPQFDPLIEKKEAEIARLRKGN
jgi:lysophospholipase L1-like esterase